MTVLSHKVTAVFGNLQYDSHVSGLTAELALLPAVNRVTCTLPAEVPVEATIGDPASIELDGGDGAATILTGKVGGLRRSERATMLEAVDAGHALAKMRPAATYEAQSPTEVVSALASDAGASADVSPSTKLAYYVAHQQRSAAEHVAALAGLAGALAGVDGDGNVSVKLRPPGVADLALLYGREFTGYQVDEIAPPPQLVLVGNGSAGAVPAPNALQQGTDALRGGGADPAASVVWSPQAALRTPLAVEAAAREANASRAARAKRLIATCWLLPALRPGQLVEIQELPDRLPAGPWLVTSVRHQVDGARGGRTRVEAVVAGSALDSALGAALGALGGLL